MVKSEFENSILNYLAEDAMILDKFINQLVGFEFEEEKWIDNYLTKNLSFYKRFVEYDFLRELDWLQILKNFKLFAGFHDTDEKIIQSEINFEEYWYIRRILQRKYFFNSEIMRYKKKYDEMKSFVGVIVKKVMNHENKKVNEYFNEDGNLISMAHKIINTEYNLYEEYSKDEWKRDKVFLEIGIKAGREIRVWNKEKL